MQRQAANEERSRQGGPQSQVGFITASVSTESFPGRMHREVQGSREPYGTNLFSLEGPCVLGQRREKIP